MSDFDLMTVRQMIDSAFGEVDSSCPVNFKILGSVLFVLARRMQLLKRHFKVQVALALANKDVTNSSFKLTEIKIHAKKLKKKGRGRSTKVYPILADDLLPVDQITTGKNKRSARKRSRQSSLHRTYLGKRLGNESSSGMSSDDEFSPRKPTAHRRPSKKYTSERHATRQSERHKDDDGYNKDVSPGARRKSGKYIDGNPTAKHHKYGKFSDEISPTERRKSGKYADNMSPAERHKFGKNADDISPTERRKAGKYADEMSPTERRKTGKYADEMSPADRRKSGKYADEMSPTERRKARKYSDEMSPTGRRKSGKYSDEMSPDERNKYSGKMTTGRRTGGKYSDQISTTEKSGSGKYYSPSDELSSESAIRGRSRSNKHGAQRGKADAELYSQKDTSSRSKETGGYDRKIRGRDTRQDDDDDDTEEQYEKIYVVTRTPSGREIREPAVLHPVVTQEQFDHLLARARALQKKLGITDKPTQWDDLRNTNLITNPKAALNMSVRLDAAETRLKNMMDVLEQIARHVPGLDIQGYLDEKSLHPDTRRGHVTLSEPLGDNRDEYFQPLDTEFDYDILDKPEPSKPKNRVTHGQFKDESNRMHDGILKTMRQAMEDAGLNNRLSISATATMVDQLRNKFKDIVKLDRAIEEFGIKIVAIDEHLTFETTNIQDNLMQMQLELETALEKMNDTLLAPKEDAAAVAQITAEFNEYIQDLDSTELIQNDLKGELEAYSQNLKIVEERMKTLRADKCTRDEMFEALDDKVTLKDINGMLTEDQFGAVNSEMRETLKHLYLTIFTKECDWQRIIGDVKEKFYESAETNQIVTLNESIRKEFTRMDKDVNYMLEILGPLKKSPTDKKIKFDDNCLCCGAPDETKKNKLSVKLWRQMISTDAVKSVKLTPEEISELCIPGQPIPHPLEIDSFVCAHDCGDIVTTKDVFDMYIKELKSPKKSNSVRTSEKKSEAEDHGTLQ